MYSTEHIVNRVNAFRRCDSLEEITLLCELIKTLYRGPFLLPFFFLFLFDKLHHVCRPKHWKRQRCSRLIHCCVIRVFVVFCLLFVCPRAQLPVDTRGREGKIRWDLTVRDNLPSVGLLFLTAGASNTWRGALVINIYGTEITTE